MPLPKIKTKTEGDVPQEGTKTEPGPNEPRARTEHGQFITDEHAEEALAALRLALKAERRYWDKGSKDWVTEPDYATRLRSAELTLAYKKGKPVEMKVTLTGDFKNYDDRLEKLISTPEGLRIAIAAGLVDSETKAIKTIQKQGSISVPVETKESHNDVSA